MEQQSPPTAPLLLEGGRLPGHSFQSTKLEPGHIRLVARYTVHGKKPRAAGMMLEYWNEIKRKALRQEKVTEVLCTLA